MKKINTFLDTIKNIGFEKCDQQNGNIEKYLAIPNIKNVRWLVPLNDKVNKKNSILLYQPSTIKGKVLKELYLRVPFAIIKCILKKNIINLNRINILNNKKLFENKIFYNEEVYYSFFLGTEGAHCKITVQISDKNKPIMYLKVTDKFEIVELFNNEEKILSLLNNTTLNNEIPNIITNTKYNQLYCFASSTTKTIKSNYRNNLSREHVDFLVNLYLSTKNKLIDEESIYYKSTNILLDKYMTQNKESMWIKDAFQNSFENIKMMKVHLGVCHRDFTFWNCYFNDNKIFVFDWEYATNDYPPYFDVLHFIIQKKILEGESCEKIYESIIENSFIYEYAKRIDVSFKNIKDFIILYLIDILLLYEFRAKEFSTSDLLNKERRLKMLKYVLEV